MVRTIIVLFLLSAAGLMSCSDAKLAQSIDGKWETTLNLTDEYGDPFVKKLIYEFEQYEADNRGAEEEGYCYPDLEVEGDTMSFVTSDMGRMYFSREY